MQYLVQYGQFNKGMTVEASNEKNAVETVINNPYFMREDSAYDFKVFEIMQGGTYTVGFNFEVNKK